MSFAEIGVETQRAGCSLHRAWIANVGRKGADLGQFRIRQRLVGIREGERGVSCDSAIVELDCARERLWRVLDVQLAPALKGLVSAHICRWLPAQGRLLVTRQFSLERAG